MKKNLEMVPLYEELVGTIFTLNKKGDKLLSNELNKIIREGLKRKNITFCGHSTEDRIMRRIMLFFDGDLVLGSVIKSGDKNRKIKEYVLSPKASMERVIETIRNYYEDSPTTKTIMEKKSFHRKELLPRVSFIKTICKVLTKFKLSKKEILKYESIKIYGNLSTVTKKTITDWKISLNKLGITLSDDIIGNYGNRGIRIDNLDSILSKLIEVINTEYSDKGLSSYVEEIKKVLNINNKVLVARTIKTPEIKVEGDDDFERAYLIFSIAGILKSSEVEGVRKRVEIDPLIKCLSQSFGISLIKKDLIGILKDVEEISSSNDHASFVLTDKNSWTKIIQKYSPKNFHKTFLLRIGMSLDELEQRLPKLEIEDVSKISSNEGIYRIRYDRSLQTRRKLVNLYRSFRGKDKILDDISLDNLLREEIIKVDNRAYKTLDYMIERIPAGDLD